MMISNVMLCYGVVGPMLPIKDELKRFAACATIVLIMLAVGGFILRAYAMHRQKKIVNVEV